MSCHIFLQSAGVHGPHFGDHRTRAYHQGHEPIPHRALPSGASILSSPSTSQMCVTGHTLTGSTEQEHGRDRAVWVGAPCCHRFPWPPNGGPVAESHRASIAQIIEESYYLYFGLLEDYEVICGMNGMRAQNWCPANVYLLSCRVHTLT